MKRNLLNNSKNKVAQMHFPLHSVISDEQLSGTKYEVKKGTQTLFLDS